MSGGVKQAVGGGRDAIPAKRLRGRLPPPLQNIVYKHLGLISVLLMILSVQWIGVGKSRDQVITVF